MAARHDPAPGERGAYTVLAGIANPATALSLLQTGVAIARAREGHVVLLQVVSSRGQRTPQDQRQEVAKEQRYLEALIEKAGITDVPVEPRVRPASSPTDGLLQGARDEGADLLLLGWPGEKTEDTADLDPVLDPVIRTAPCDVAVLRGTPPALIKTALVPVAGGPHAQTALGLAQSLVDPEAGRVIAVHYLRGEPSSRRELQANALLQGIVNSLATAKRIERQVVWVDDLQKAMLRQAGEHDLLVLGASNKGILDKAMFGGLPVEVARAHLGTAILTRRHEGRIRLRLRRLWETASAPFPTLTTGEQATIYQRLHRAARPSADFFVMILLSAVIAILGLLLNSTAVIIGAMLVAPLMSPVLSMSMSLVQGNLRLLGTATESTLKGAAMAIAVSAAITVISPLQLPTAEILSRTRPTLLDLVVALAAGAAAGYAVSREDVSAALPGVAIAVALVPPLGVVGYGVASQQPRIGGGAALLFVANLSAILLAAALIFLLLGFRPTRAERQRRLQRGLLVSLAAMLLIAIPLALISRTSFRQLQQKEEVTTILTEEIADDTGRVVDVVVEPAGEGIAVDATLYAMAELDAERLDAIQRRLTEEVGAPVTLRATVLQAKRMEIEAQPYPIKVGDRLSEKP